MKHCFDRNLFKSGLVALVIFAAICTLGEIYRGYAGIFLNDNRIINTITMDQQDQKHLLQDDHHDHLVKHDHQNIKSDENEHINKLSDSLDLILREYRGAKNVADLQNLNNILRVLKTRHYPNKERTVDCVKCNLFKFNRLISPKNVCGGSQDIDLLILITTIPSRIKEREAVRKTWASHTKDNTGNVRHLFMFGGGWEGKEADIIQEESTKFNDIIQDDYKDAYYNLSYKVIMGYKWALTDCPNVKYILRTADDNFVNVPGILSWLVDNGSQHNAKHGQIGFLMDRGSLGVYRYRDQKWYISWKEYKRKFYPPFAVGTAFLFSLPSVKKIVKAAEDVVIFPLEDVWFGLIMEKIGMPIFSVAWFNMPNLWDFRKQLESGQCPSGHHFLTVHYVEIVHFNTLWEQCEYARTLPTGIKIPPVQ